MVVIKVLKAYLNRSFDSFGKMDPFAVVDCVSGDGSSYEVARTMTHWGGHMRPVWEHVSCRQPYEPGSVVRFRVLEKDFKGLAASTFCGEACMTMRVLFDGVLDGAAAAGWSRPHSLTLRKNGEETGSIVVQGAPDAGTGEGEFTPVDAELFEAPVRRVGVSGGTAPFFHLRLRSPAPGAVPDRWIGKDLARAIDELAFYEQKHRLARSAGGGPGGILHFMFDYAGVVECRAEGDRAGVPPKQLLVLENLRAGCASLRMLDIKIGEKTAAAGWHGKSRWRAFRQRLLDGFTNSQCEGFRLEGFEGPPPALASEDPLLDMRLEGGGAVHRKAFRMMLQRMTAADMLMHFLDLHHCHEEAAPPPPPPPAGGEAPPPAGPAAAGELLSPAELGELTLREALGRLGRLALACRGAPAPQKWIGSSVALAFDAQLPPRATPEAELRAAVRLKIFDWGRSELNTEERHARLAPGERRDREHFWGQYVHGIDRLAWEAARLYRNRFASGEWHLLRVVVEDFDSMSASDFIGLACLKLEPTAETTVPLLTRSGTPVRGRDGPATLTYAMAFCEFPASSPLSGAWRVTLLRAADLPVRDCLQGTSDPYASLIAVSKDGSACFQQESSVIKRNLNPEWRETFELPLARSGPRLLAEALEGAAAGLGQGELAPLLPSAREAGGACRRADAAALAAWSARLDAAGRGRAPAARAEAVARAEAAEAAEAAAAPAAAAAAAAATAAQPAARAARAARPAVAGCLGACLGACLRACPQPRLGRLGRRLVAGGAAPCCPAAATTAR